MELSPAVLENNDVRLEPLEERHRAPLRAVAAEPRIWTYILSAGPFDAFFDAQLAADAKGARISHAVWDKGAGRMVGSTAFFMIDAPNATVEIGGTWYAPEVWGGRVNPACKRLLLERAFASGVRRIELKTDARNARSRAAIEKLGAQLDGVHRKRHVMPDGFVRDTAYYSILVEEWPAVRATLDARLARS